MKKKLIGLLLILIFLVTAVTVPNTAYATTDKYLVLVETKAGKWIAYKDLAYPSGGQIVVKASATSKALGLTYKNNDKALTIQKGKKKLTLTKNSKNYKYYDGSKNVSKTATYKTHAKNISKKSYQMVHYSVLGNLVYTSYYTGSNATSYKILGYKGVICFSTTGKITTLPNINNVVNTDGEKLSETNITPTPTEVPKNDNVKYDGTVTIGGVSIPKLTDFAKDALDGPYWGNDNYVDGERSLKDALDKYSVQMKKDIQSLGDESNSGATSQLAVKNNSISVEANGDSSLTSISLSKTEENGVPIYQIYLSTSLTYTELDKELGNANYTKISNNALLLLSNIVTSDGDLLYKTIYKAYEEDSSIISKDKYTTFGNFQIKYRVENGHGVIFSIKAK